MKVALISKNKLCFIDETFPKPTANHPLHDPWIHNNNLILSRLQRFVSENIAQSILWFENAFTMWENLRNRFSKGDIFRLSDLQDDLICLQQGSLDVLDYYTQLKSIWEQIDIYRHIRDCTCAFLYFRNLDPCLSDSISKWKWVWFSSLFLQRQRSS